MRSSVHLNGHPLHPMLVGFPAAYLIGSACIDAWARTTDRPAWFRTARHLNTLGISSALVAAVPGVVDYMFTVPPRSSAKTRATDHMFANLSALALFAAARLGRKDADSRPPAWSVMLEMCGAGLVAAAGWMGGTLVYRNQIAVDHRFANAGKWRVAAKTEGNASADAVDVGADDELKLDQMKLVRIGERRIAIARTEHGYSAFDDRCTHKGGPLADGALICGTVQCPWHGSQFDVETGRAKQGPAEKGIETYDVSQANGRLWLNLESRRPR